MSKAVAILLVCILLAGCTTTSAPPLVPAQLLACAPQPLSPADPTQRDVGLYVLDLAAAGDDCRTKLGSVRRILNPE